MILPATLSILNATFVGRERGIAFAVWGSTIGGMAAVGPLLGGWLTTDFSWRWAFGINLPLGVIIVIGALLCVRESKADQVRRIDVVGAALSIVLFTSLVLGLIEGRTYGWWETAKGAPEWWTLDVSPIPFIFAITLVTLVTYIAWGLHRERQGKSTLIAFSLFRIPSFRNGNIAALIVSLSGSAIPALEEQAAEAADAARAAFTDATRAATFTAAGFMVAGLLASLSLGGTRAGGRQSQTPEGTPASSAS